DFNDLRGAEEELVWDNQPFARGYSSDSSSSDSIGHWETANEHIDLRNELLTGAEDRPGDKAVDEVGTRERFRIVAAVVAVDRRGVDRRRVLRLHALPAADHAVLCRAEEAAGSGVVPGDGLDPRGDLPGDPRPPLPGPDRTADVDVTDRTDPVGRQD